MMLEVVLMALSPAKKASDARHIAKLDIIKIQPYKEEGAAIRAAAKAANKSLQSYVLEAVREKMERDGASSKAKEAQPEGTGDTTDDSPGQFPYSFDEDRTPQSIVDASPTQDKELSPAELSIDEWIEWLHRREGESVEEWRDRANRGSKGFSAIDVARRVGKLPQWERDLLMGFDPETLERARKESEKVKQRPPFLKGQNVPLEAEDEGLPF